MNYSNMTFSEALKYSTPDHALSLVQEAIDEAQREVEELRNLERRVELIEEQLYFAREVLDDLEEALMRCKSAKQCREAFNRVVENSSFDY